MIERNVTAILMIVVPLFSEVTKEKMIQVEADIKTQIIMAMNDGYNAFQSDEYYRGRRDGMKEGLAFRKRIEGAA